MVTLLQMLQNLLQPLPPSESGSQFPQLQKLHVNVPQILQMQQNWIFCISCYSLYFFSLLPISSPTLLTDQTLWSPREDVQSLIKILPYLLSINGETLCWVPGIHCKLATLLTHPTPPHLRTLQSSMLPINCQVPGTPPVQTLISTLSFPFLPQTPSSRT